MDIRYATLVRAPRARVWQALTTGDGLDGWFTRGAEVEPRVGGRIVLRWKDWGVDRLTTEETGHVLAFEPERRFSFDWSPQGPGKPTRVEFTLEDDAAGTLVTVTDAGWEDAPAVRPTLLDCAAGWGEALTLLKFHVEHGVRY